MSDYDYLKDGYHGYVNKEETYDFGTLIELHLAEWNGDDSWECGEWCLDTGKDEPVHIAHCDGWSGVEWQEGFYNLPVSVQKKLDELVEPYEFTGLYHQARVEQDMEKAAPDDKAEAEFVIIESANYFYSDCNAEYNNQPKVLTDGDPQDPTEIVFDTYADAEKHLEEITGETYYLNHGEAGRPDYAIYKLI